MKKYKICPSCGKQNEPVVLECLYCEADLTRVAITDEESEQARQEEPVAEARSVRVCECGAENPPNARKCIACGEDISDILPTAEGEAQVVSFVLSSMDGQYAFRVTESEITVGRTENMSEYLESKIFVSRRQAKLTLEDGALYIENLSKTNYTYVNNRRIAAKTQLVDGDEIGMGGIEFNGSRQPDAAYFLVRVGGCI